MRMRFAVPRDIAAELARRPSESWRVLSLIRDGRKKPEVILTNEPFPPSSKNPPESLAVEQALKGWFGG